VYCKGGAFEGRRACPRRGVVYCCESGGGADMAKVIAVKEGRETGRLGVVEFLRRLAAAARV
jgi:hypothetical protein